MIPNYKKEREKMEARRRIRRYAQAMKRLNRGNPKGTPTILKVEGGDWVWNVSGIDGTRRYMGYTKTEAKALYHEEFLQRLERNYLILSKE